jgi:hypothetical protein
MLLASFVTIHVVFSLQEMLCLLYSGLDLDPTSVASKLGTGGIKTILFKPGKDGSNTFNARRKLSENFSQTNVCYIPQTLVETLPPSSHQSRQCYSASERTAEE